MKKRTLSLVLALFLVLAFVPAAFAAETIEIGTGGIVGAALTGVTSTSDTPYKDWHEGDELEEYGYTGGAVKTYFCDTAPVTLSTAFGYVYWWGNEVTAPPTETDDIVGTKITMNQSGTYMFVLDEGMYVFYVVVGGSAPAPAPTTPATPTTPAVPPAPSTPVTGNTAALKTTAGLVSVIPPTPTAGQDLAYTVQKGETLWGIAYNYYGSMGNATVSKIKNANAAYFKKTKNILEAGAVITLPAKGLINPVTQGSLDKAAGVYLVKKGDTLADIAKVYYGDSKQWKKIYEANKDRVKLVGGSPMIYEKQWLVIPE